MRNEYPTFTLTGVVFVTPRDVSVTASVAAYAPSAVALKVIFTVHVARDANPEHPLVVAAKFAAAGPVILTDVGLTVVVPLFATTTVPVVFAVLFGARKVGAKLAVPTPNDEPEPCPMPLTLMYIEPCVTRAVLGPVVVGPKYTLNVQGFGSGQPVNGTV